MSSSSISSSAAAATDALLVRDIDGRYRPALAEEVLSQARRVLAHRVRRGATMSGFLRKPEMVSGSSCLVCEARTGQCEKPTTSWPEQKYGRTLEAATGIDQRGRRRR
jgi:hypothetical protein